ncbi:hypothetical protein [Sporomusa paucivorans]|uniref:hypothetical protein n=1 Tax=Sporomusa paucivorans TaxID=2376 RepID=UPI00357125A5
MQLPETISEITNGLNPAQLDELLAALTDEVMRLSKVVAGYEVAAKLSAGNYKKAQAKAALLLKGAASPSIVKLIVEGNEDVIQALNIWQGDEALYLMGKAELEGRTAQYQAVKKLIDLKVEELRAFKAGHR